MNISNDKHYSITLPSLLKQFQNVKKNGKIKVKEIFSLVLIKKLLEDSSLTYKDISFLVKYYDLISSNKNICFSNLKSVINTTVQEPVIINPENPNSPLPSGTIYFWQESLDKSLEEIQNEIINVDLTTKQSFPQGYTLNFQNYNLNTVGRIVFLFTGVNIDNLPSESDYQIYDSLNNNITSLFIQQYVPALSSMLIVSNSVYSSGSVSLKINTI